MTFPGGQPGGYPGQGPQQPLQGPGGYGRPPGSGLKLGIPQIANLVVGGLGVLILFLAFASVDSVPDVPGAEGSSFYEAGFGWIPALLFVGGVLHLKSFLPGDDKKVGLLPPVLITGVVLAFLFTIFSASGDLGAGGIMVMIFGIIQMLAAIGALLLDLGIVKPPAPNPYAQQPGGMYPPSGAFQQQQPPAQPQYGQQPPPPPPGQQTTFAPQQGQFGQQQPPPGTPPGGYPQQ